MTPITTATHEQYWLENLLIADGLAKRYGLHRSAAVRRCARRMRAETRSKRLFELAGLIIKASDEKVTSMASGLFNEMKKDGLL